MSDETTYWATQATDFERDAAYWRARAAAMAEEIEELKFWRDANAHIIAERETGYEREIIRLRAELDEAARIQCISDEIIDDYRDTLGERERELDRLNAELERRGNAEQSLISLAEISALQGRDMLGRAPRPSRYHYQNPAPTGRVGRGRIGAVNRWEPWRLEEIKAVLDVGLYEGRAISFAQARAIIAYAKDWDEAAERMADEAIPF